LAYGGIVTVAVLTEGDKWPFFATAPGTKKTSSSTFCGASMSAHGIQLIYIVKGSCVGWPDTAATKT